MELDELKEVWVALDNRLKKNEELKESIILDMIQSKTGKSINKLINWEVFGAVVLLLAIPLITFLIDRRGGRFLMWDIFMIYTMIVCVVGFFWLLYKIYGLMKIDLSKSISDNIYYMNRYNIQIKRERMVMLFIAVPLFAIFAILSYAAMNASLPWWIFLVCVFTFAILLCYWSYKRLYGKKIDSILKSLNEIKELKEE